MPNPCILKLIFAIFLVISIIFGWKYKSNKNRRLSYLNNYQFPKSIETEISNMYPHLIDTEIQEVINGLKTYFRLAVEANGYIVAMPSKIVDTAWHSFLLHTKSYEKFSTKTFGKFFHHIPTEQTHTNSTISDSYKKIWVLSCLDEGISPEFPEKLPLLFRLDEDLKIEDGYIYSLTNDFGKNYSNGVYSSTGCGGGCGGC